MNHYYTNNTDLKSDIKTIKYTYKGATVSFKTDRDVGNVKYSLTILFWDVIRTEQFKEYATNKDWRIGTNTGID